MRGRSAQPLAQGATLGDSSLLWGHKSFAWQESNASFAGLILQASQAKACSNHDTPNRALLMPECIETIRGSGSGSACCALIVPTSPLCSSAGLGCQNDLQSGAGNTTANSVKCPRAFPGAELMTSKLQHGDSAPRFLLAAAGRRSRAHQAESVSELPCDSVREGWWPLARRLGITWGTRPRSRWGEAEVAVQGRIKEAREFESRIAYSWQQSRGRDHVTSPEA